MDLSRRQQDIGVHIENTDPARTMSDFEASWPQTGELAEIQDHFNSGISILKEGLILPGDLRYQVAAALISMSGPDATVATLGEPGTGKTALGNYFFSEEDRVEVTSTHTAEKLLGYPNPIKPSERVPGDIDPDNPEDVSAFLNEFNHLRNTGPLHALWDGDRLVVGDRVLNLENIAVYLSMNFPDGNRTHQPDQAALSRMAAIILTGDGSREVARELSGIDLADRYAKKQTTQNEQLRHKANGEKPVGPIKLLPPAAVRQILRWEVAFNSPLDKSHTTENAPDYMSSVVFDMQDSGLLVPPVATDTRVYLGWQSTARAMLLAKGNAHLPNQTVNKTKLKEVAPLGLGSLAYLSREGRDLFEDTWEKNPQLTPLDAAIAARWVIATIAAKRSKPDLSENELYAHLEQHSFGNIADAEKKEQASEALYKRIVRGERPESTNNHDRSRTTTPRRRS